MGPLEGLRIIEMASLGAGPFCGMMLADMGAEVIRIEGGAEDPTSIVNPLSRSRKSIACDLKNPDAIEVALRLIASADGLMEGFRPGVMERLGLGPDVCLQRNPGLVYGRITGWGQGGPLAHAAGHDINYIAITGALHAIGPLGGKPVPPLNLVGDFGGGGMLMAFGMVCALLVAQRTGEGQVVDAAMVDGAHSMMALFHGFRAWGWQDDAAGAGFLGGEAHFYDTYETRDGKFVAIGCIEPKFYDLLIERAGLDRETFSPHGFRFKADAETRSKWAELKVELSHVIKSRTRDEWCELLEGTDACFAPVLTLDETRFHIHNRARKAFVEVGGNWQPSPAPRFGKTVPEAPQPAVAAGAHTRYLLARVGYSEQEIAGLFDSGAVR